jgi:chromosome segregation ATPase
MVKKPFDGCNASSLVAPLNPLQGAQDQADQVHGVFPDQDQAMAIAETLYEEYCAKMEALEEKKGAVTGKISSAIDSLEKKRKEHVDMAKEDPKNASQHKDKIAMLATKIDDLMSKLEKVERSKKAKEEKKDKETIKENEEPKGATSTSGLAKVLRQLAQNLPATKGMSSKEIAGIEKLINTILSKASAGEIALAIGKAQLALDNSTKNVGGKPAMPTAPKKSGNFSLNNDR